MDYKIPAVSVIIPFYNGLDHVLKSIESLKAQTYRRFEVIYVDDGSDFSDVEIERITNLFDSRFCLVRQKHLGAGAARNNGFSYAKGDYVIFLDSDDQYDKQLLEKLHKSAVLYSSDLVLCNAKLDDGTAFYAIEPELSKKYATCCIKTKEIEDLFQITIPAPWNKLIKTSLIRQNNLQFLNLDNSNDLTFTFSALALSNTISLIEDSLLTYTTNNPNSIQSNPKKNPSCISYALDKLFDILIKNDLFSSLEKTFLILCQINFEYNLNRISNNELRLKLLETFVNSKFYNYYIKLNSENNFIEKLSECKNIILRSEFSAFIFNKCYSNESVVVIYVFNDLKGIKNVHKLLRKINLNLQPVVVINPSSSKEYINQFITYYNSKKELNCSIETDLNEIYKLICSKFKKCIFCDSDYSISARDLRKLGGLNKYDEDAVCFGITIKELFDYISVTNRNPSNFIERFINNLYECLITKPLININRPFSTSTSFLTNTGFEIARTEYDFFLCFYSLITTSEHLVPYVKNISHSSNVDCFYSGTFRESDYSCLLNSFEFNKDKISLGEAAIHKNLISTFFLKRIIQQFELYSSNKYFQKFISNKEILISLSDQTHTNGNLSLKSIDVSDIPFNKFYILIFKILKKFKL